MKKFITQEMVALWNHNPYEVLEMLAQSVLQSAVQESLRMLPMAHENIVKQAAILHKSSKEFYDRHPDLIPHKEVVAKLVDSHESLNPGLPLEQLWPTIASEARAVIGMKPENKKKRLDDVDIIVGTL